MMHDWLTQVHPFIWLHNHNERYDGGNVFLGDESTTIIIGRGKVKLRLIDGRIIKLPSMSLNLTFPWPMILVVESSPRKKLPPSYLSYSRNHSLWGFIWNDAPQSTNHASWSACVLEESKYTSPPSSLEVFYSIEGSPSDPLTLSTLLDMHCFLKCPCFPHLQHTFTNFLTDLDLPSEFHLPLENLDLFLSWESPLVNNVYVLY